MWDPSLFLAQAQMPFLWVNGTNDFAFPPDTMAKSIETVKGKSAIAMIVRMPHGHGGIGEKPVEIHNFANLITGHAEALPIPEFAAPKIENTQATTVCCYKWQIKRAELNFTTDTGSWKERVWQTTPVRVEGDRLSAPLSGKIQALYFNVYSENDITFSSKLAILE